MPRSIRPHRWLGTAVAALILVAGCAGTGQVTETGPATQPASSSATQPASSPATQPASSPATQPASSSATQPASSSATQPASSSAIQSVAPTDTPTGVSVVGTIATGLTTPWGIAFLPDGTALVTERDTARIVAIEPGQVPRALGTVEGVRPGGEGGLLGIAVSPDFAADHTVYVYLTSETDNRVAAITITDDLSALTGQRTILDGIPSARIHDGGRLLGAPDGTLFVATGDAADSSTAQRLDSLGGKILHINRDGTAAAGNPLPEAPLIYSYGHRNVQGLALDSDGQLWASEFGQDSFDELNRITPGGNYGWPIHEGPSDDPGFTAPYAYWPTDQASPSGLAITGQTAWMAGLRGVRLWMIPLESGAGPVEPTALLQGDFGRLRTVVAAPDGGLWLSTSNTDGRGDPRGGDDRILRLDITT